jgi:parvulin-like peptidyl-prolyl isomerase
MILLDVKEADNIQQNLRAKERETMKQRLRKMNDTEREITKKLLDIGIAAYIITNEDRELFSREYQIPEETDVLAQGIVDANLTEDGYNDTRDYVDDVPPNGEGGVEMNVDNGDYGDNAVRRYDDYTAEPTYDVREDYGV